MVKKKKGFNLLHLRKVYMDLTKGISCPYCQGSGTLAPHEGWNEKGSDEYYYCRIWSDLSKTVITERGVSSTPCLLEDWNACPYNPQVTWVKKGDEIHIRNLATGGDFTW